MTEQTVQRWVNLLLVCACRFAVHCWLTIALKRAKHSISLTSCEELRGKQNCAMTKLQLKAHVAEWVSALAG